MNLIENKIIIKNENFIKKISKSEIKDGINCYENFFIYKKEDKYLAYDRICDHNGGRLIYNYKKDTIKCPLHNWMFNYRTGFYSNVELKKKELKIEDKGDHININYKINKQNFIKKNIKKKVILRFINHSCLYVETPDIKFLTDPWLIGPAFNNGWWLSKKSPVDSLDLINNVDFIYISHNHPDHLHLETLSKIKKNKLIFTPKFESGSTDRYLKDLGFDNIKTLNFGYSYSDAQNNFALQALKSGDFRDDSGLYFSTGKFDIVFAVDSNNLNFGDLPDHPTIYASTFAGGASGFPLCFDNYNDDEKKTIINQNLISLKKTKLDIIRKIEPSFFLPYAGFFKELPSRDSYIFKNNTKLKISDYLKLIPEKVKLLDVDKYQIFNFNGNTLADQSIDKKDKIIDLDPGNYVDRLKKKFQKIDQNKITKYFTESLFNKDLNLIIYLTNDDFNQTYESINVIFSQTKEQKPKVIFNIKENAKDVFEKFNINTIEIKVRKEAFLNVINNKLPWEDFLIGFQCRIKRYPNVYNVGFWYHFSNIYVRKTFFRKREIECFQCEKIFQNLNLNEETLSN